MNAGRQCPGYRSQVDLIFREETKNVIKKAKVKHEKAKQKNADPFSSKSTTPDSAFPSPPPSRGNSPRDMVVRSSQPSQVISIDYLNITPSIEDRATAFFLSNYVIGDNGPTRGHLDHLSDLYNSDGVDDNLVAAVHAV